MNKHLPKFSDSIELLILALIALGVHLVIGEWEWTVLFILGFIWNWSVLNGWAIHRTSQKTYRFSMLAFVVKGHRILINQFHRLPMGEYWGPLLPATFYVWLLSYFLGADITWPAILCGSLTLEIVRRELKLLRR